MSRTSSMMTRIKPTPAAMTAHDESTRDNGALHALQILPR